MQKIHTWSFCGEDRQKERKHKRKDKSRLRKDNELTKKGRDGISLSTDFLTSCVWIMEVGVQAFFQEP